MNYNHIILLYLLVVNVVAFWAYWDDKRKAKRNAWRTPEATLLLLAAIGGSVGALVAMQLFRHKTNHPQFYIGVPLIFVVQIGVALWLWLK